LIHMELLLSVPSSESRTRKEPPSFRAERAFAFTPRNTLIRQLTHGLGGVVAVNSLHRMSQSFARKTKGRPGA